MKEVWEVPTPLNRVIHTMGWPLRAGKRHREFGGSFIYPLGDDQVAIGMVVGLDYTDATLSVHDLLQELKTHPFVRGILAGGTRVAWGAKTIPEGGFQALPDRLSFPGGMIVGDSAGFVNVPALKGVHYAMKSGLLAAEAAVGAAGPGETPWAPGALDPYDEAIRESYVWNDLQRVRNMRPAFKHGFYRGALLAGLSLTTLGTIPPRDEGARARRGCPGDRRRPGRRLRGAGRAARLRQALERLPLGEQDPRRRPEPHPRGHEGPARAGRDAGCTCARRRCTRSWARRARPGTSSTSR